MCHFPLMYRMWKLGPYVGAGRIGIWALLFYSWLFCLIGFNLNSTPSSDVLYSLLGKKADWCTVFREGDVKSCGKRQSWWQSSPVCTKVQLTHGELGAKRKLTRVAHSCKSCKVWGSVLLIWLEPETWPCLLVCSDLYYFFLFPQE